MTRLGERVQVQILKAYSTDYDKEYHLRELARELDMDHTSLRPHLNSLKEMGIIREEEKGRNKVFSLNQKSDLLPYYLMLAEDYLNKAREALEVADQLEEMFEERYRTNRNRQDQSTREEVPEVGNTR